MKEVQSIEWFKNEISKNLQGYELSYRFFEDGDFGALAQVEFNSKKIGGNVDFWGLGWVGVFIWDYEKEEEIFNVLLEPCQEKEKKEAFNRLQELLGVTTENGKHLPGEHQ